ncbi:MAG: 2-succinyl-5-enolpyruvyl-6-hydroxy-3-cyclohexene-1-carboxylic-acid synthase [Microthrixaceae bacterium]
MAAHPTEGPGEVDPDVAVTFAATLLDQWRARGVRHVIVSPGSRSTPLVLGLQWVLDHQRADDPAGLVAHLVLDERSAAFQAVGLARATAAPTVLVCTSGTAAVEYHPAVVEAHQAALPMLICTADRPPELQGSGAPQTIDQQALYGTAVRAFLEPGPPDATASPSWRPLADEAFDACLGTRPGPVQLNLAFREPLVGRVTSLPPPLHAHVTASGRGGPELAPAAGATGYDPGAVPSVDRTVFDRLVQRCSGSRVVVMAGERSVPGDGQPDGARDVLECADALGWPVLADPLSGLRRHRRVVVPHFDPMLRCAEVAEALRPEVVIRLGALVSSKVTNQWLAQVPGQVAVDPAGWFPDPDRVVTERLHVEPSILFRALAEASVSGGLEAAPQEWSDRWWRAGGAVGQALAQLEPSVAEADALAGAVLGVPDGGHLVVSSSMPVRDLEWFGPAVPDGVIVHANRGANGIDGVLATAVGVAHTGAPTVAVLGDLAMLHDIGSLVSARPLGNLAVVVVDNSGGGIFSFLSQHELLGDEPFERWWGTPSGVDLAAVAKAFDLVVRPVVPGALDADLRRVLAGDRTAGAALFRVESNREENLAGHRRLLDAAAVAARRAVG